MSVAKNHHYIPQVYLREFAVSNKKGFFIEAFDIIKNKHFTPNIRNVGSRTHFNRIEIEGFDPDYVEKQMSDAEVKYGMAIKNIQTTNTFNGESKNQILEMMSHLAIRNPVVRENIGVFLKKSIKSAVRMVANHEKIMDKINKIFKQDNPTSTLDLKMMEDILETGEYDFFIRTEKHLDLEYKMIPMIYNFLQMRNWVLVVTNQSQGYFITSDNPVVLCYEDESKMPLLMRNSPGFALKNTVVYFPISKTHGLIGKFNGASTVVPVVDPITSKLVATMNTVFMSHCDCQFYTPFEGFHFFNDKHEMLDAGYLKAKFKC